MVKFQENLANRGVLRVQMNCLSAMYPHISLDDNMILYPRGAVDLGNGYALLQVCDDTASYTMFPPRGASPSNPLDQREMARDQLSQ